MKLKYIVLLALLAQATLVQAVDMPLRKTDGTLHNLNDFKGNWVVVNYWATWCPPCLAEMPDLQAFHDKHVGRGAMVIGINAENLAPNQLNYFLDSYFITYPVYSSPLTQHSELGAVPGLPTTFLVSPEGNVEARQVGSITSQMLEDFISNWRAE
ncbi:MAG: TlpA family protein disulfide reductase [Gammaproteobacteria bacterium]|nr:TlpA family protein disulfide reductase [Gammaproteobacteria bacterium]